MPVASIAALLAFVAAANWLEPPPPMGPPGVRAVEARYEETFVHRSLRVRKPRLGTVRRGTRLVVRGEVEGTPQDVRCRGSGGYAVWPFGIVCKEHVRPTEDAPQAPPTRWSALPHRYAMVRADGTPMFAGPEEARAQVPSRTLERGMTIAVAGSVRIDGARYLQDPHGHLVPRDGLSYLGSGSAFAGVFLGGRAPAPDLRWGIPRARRIRLYRTSDLRGRGTAVEGRPLLVVRAEARDDVPRLLVRPAAAPLPEGWVRRKDVALVRLSQIPPRVDRWLAGHAHGSAAPWIRVDLSEQVAVVYRGRRAYFATVVSSGAAVPTPRGVYPVWGAVATVDMDNQAYEDDPYMVQQVPWSLFFQGHNALHGAYWHDRFGRRKSHGCINLPPRAALWIFRFVGPALPSGWTGYFPEPERAPLVYVEDPRRSGGRFVQDRPPGPPDPEEERKKAEAAARRRARASPNEAPARLPDPGVPSDVPKPPEPEPVPPPHPLPGVYGRRPAPPCPRVLRRSRSARPRPTGPPSPHAVPPRHGFGTDRATAETRPFSRTSGPRRLRPVMPVCHRPRSWVRRLALSVALSVCAVSACGPKLAPVEVPNGGIRLAYDLSPGRTFEGHVRRSQTLSGPFGSLNRLLEYDVRLAIAGKDPNRGDILVRATFHNVKIQWNVPPSSGFNMSIDDFIQSAVRQVQGMEVRFNVGMDGEVHYLPPVPPEADEQLGLVIQAVLDSLDEAFLKVPGKKLTPGTSWESKEKKGRKGKLGRYRKGVQRTTFKGLFKEPGTGAVWALLEVEDRGEEVITTKSGSRQKEWHGTTEAYFSVTDAFLARRKGELRQFDPTEGTTFTKLDVTWRKVSDGAAPAGDVKMERQRITDPCDPDYVGFEECPADAPADAPAGSETAGGGAEPAGEAADAPQDLKTPDAAGRDDAPSTAPQTAARSPERNPR